MDQTPRPDCAAAAAPCPTRRAVLAAAGAAGVGVALAGCQAYGNDSGGGDPPAAPPAGTGGAANSGPAGGGAALAKTAEIPVGGGKIFADKGVVVTQPTAGEFKAFSAVCTHQNCTVVEVKGGTINCDCHGSRFKVADGSVATGPATKPLATRTVTVEGDSLKLG